MAKVGELDWTDLYEGRVGEQEDPLSKPVNKDCHKGGEHITEEDLRKDVEFILDGFRQLGVKSATKEEFENRLKQIYPELNKTDAEWDEVEKQWDNFFNIFFTGAQTKVGDSEPVEWGTGESFRDRLTKAERDRYDKESAELSKEMLR